MLKNGVLVDGKGQPRSDKSYGWIPRFLDSSQISYSVGDASRAYPGTGLDYFRRHLILLRPSVVVVYDVLKADHPAQWQWLLHSDHEIQIEKNMITASNDNGKSTVHAIRIGTFGLQDQHRVQPGAS